MLEFVIVGNEEGGAVSEGVGVGVGEEEGGIR
jgi:hypothetical protein